VLFTVSVCVLVLKKKREEYMLKESARDWPTFLLDSSKQICGSGWAHVANLACATAFGARAGGTGCEWYWVNIMIDTTVGVFIEYLFLLIVTDALECATGRTGALKSGSYRKANGDIQASRYFSQLAVWLLCVTIMKFVVVLIIMAFQSPILHAAQTVVGIFAGDSRMELVFVMIITPCCMNAFQFWITDSFIKEEVNTETIEEERTVSLQP